MSTDKSTESWCELLADAVIEFFAQRSIIAIRNQYDDVHIAIIFDAITDGDYLCRFDPRISLCQEPQFYVVICNLPNPSVDIAVYIRHTPSEISGIDYVYMRCAGFEISDPDFLDKLYHAVQSCLGQC